MGGSEWSSIYGLRPWGCRRKLAYFKRGDTPDFPAGAVTGPMQRGHALEPLVADRYVVEAGRSVRKRKSWPARGPEWMQGHPDRHIVSGNGNPPGILECKTTNPFSFKKFQEDGLPDGYIMQLQHYLAMTGYTWGSFAILEPLNWQFEPFDVKRDEGLISEMKAEGERFLREVENGPLPDRLDHHDRRCATCAFRKTCQGEAFEADIKAAMKGDPNVEIRPDDELKALVAQRAEVKALEDEMKEHLEGIEDRMRARMKAMDLTAVQIETARVFCRPVTSRRLDGKRLKAEQPKIAEKYTTETVSKPVLRVYPI